MFVFFYYLWRKYKWYTRGSHGVNNIDHWKIGSYCEIIIEAIWRRKLIMGRLSMLHGHIFIQSLIKVKNFGKVMAWELCYPWHVCLCPFWFLLSLVILSVLFHILIPGLFSAYHIQYRFYLLLKSVHWPSIFLPLFIQIYDIFMEKIWNQ